MALFSQYLRRLLRVLRHDPPFFPRFHAFVSFLRSFSYPLTARAMMRAQKRWNLSMNELSRTDWRLW